MKRRLSAILAADVVGYSRMIRADEENTLAALRTVLAEVVEPAVARHRGRIVKLMGDGLLVEFVSAVDAVASAAEVQRAMIGWNDGKPKGQYIVFRIGVNLGDVVIDGNDILGDGVNLAARLEACADPGAICVADAVYEQVRDRLDLVFANLGAQKLKNIDRPVMVWQWNDSTHASKPPPIDNRPQLPEKPSIAVMPFDNMSGDPEQAYFSDGISDDIITDLSRYEDLFVSARHSSFAYRDKSISGPEIAGELGVHYIVTGSVRRAGDRIRVTASLTDPWAGLQLWSERYDRDLTDIFEVQDEITSIIVNTLSGEISRQHYQRSLTKSANMVNAYDHVLRAFDYVWKFDPDGHRKAIKEAERALALDPHNARAHAIISWAYLHFYNNALTEDGDADLQRCADAARAAVEADDREPWAHTVLGWVYHWRDRATDKGLAELDRAVSLNPGNVHFRSLRAFAFTYAGQSERALAELGSAMKLNPHFPVTYHLFYARALFNLRRYSEAVPHVARVRAVQANHPNALALAAACYAANGQKDEAHAAFGEIQRASERFTVDFAAKVLPFELAEERDHFISMFKLASLSE